MSSALYSPNTSSPAPLIRFLLYPLIFTMQYAYEGIVAGVGVLLIYPFLSMIADIFKDKISGIESFYITSFCGVFFGILYVLSIGMIDWGLYTRFVFVFPASMTASTMLLSWLGTHDHHPHHFYEPAPFIEACVAAFLIIMFSFLRDFFAHGSLDLRFGAFGFIFTFGVDTPFKSKVIDLSSQVPNYRFSPLQLRVFSFWMLALLFNVMSFQKIDKGE